MSPTLDTVYVRPDFVAEIRDVDLRDEGRTNAPRA
jgi:hypothetical protein